MCLYSMLVIILSILQWLQHMMKHNVITFLDPNLCFEGFNVQLWLPYVEVLPTVSIGGGAVTQYTIFILHSVAHSSQLMDCWYQEWCTTSQNKDLRKRWRHHFSCDRPHYQQRCRTPELSFWPSSSLCSHESVCPGEGCPTYKTDINHLNYYTHSLMTVLMFRFT